VSRILTLDRRGFSLHCAAETVEVRLEGTLVRSIPLHGLQRVVLRSDTALSSATLAGLVDAGIDVLAFGGRRGERVAHAVGRAHNDARIRVAQAQSLLAPDFVSAFARRVVTSKVREQRRFVAHLGANRPDQRKRIFDAERTLSHCLGRLNEPCLDLEAVRGLEGSAAAAYFRALAAVMPPALGFTARVRRPPRDPVNVLLSLGYTLLISAAVRACHVAGLDPMIGFLHSIEHGRPALACDLIEPLRPRVDRLAWELFRQRTLLPEHFRFDRGACLLGKAGRSHAYGSLLPLMLRCERHLLRETRIIARSFRMRSRLPEDAHGAPDSTRVSG
jgi:CRISPR-associated protein Cas1